MERGERVAGTCRNYWLSTTRPDGRPHAKPVWGLWLDGAFLFSTHPETVTARNLGANTNAVVHLESGDRVAILEGRAEPLEDPEALAEFTDAYEAKYGWRVDPADPGELEAIAVYVLRPRIGLSWTESELAETITRWSFPPSAVS